MTTTPTGIEIRTCGTCSQTHPVTRNHCTQCGAPSLFLNAEGYCLNHI